ncbi:biosynthetic arginine decarboxylase [Epibacterium sp. SM1979]|uniref:Arginine decarboxylase n=2 Tax=Tritonibacter litoralis TaxID=2662264 RepID=A0A843YLL5_9RHOB|nr:biosynthetic arginine decarboxylase [Tritonibacter litoralis]MQQ10059.1 biosynthetic arginine decarboxylase [Tritonibacter litoralis]
MAENRQFSPLYGLDRWGAGLLDVNDAGEVTLRAPNDGLPTSLPKVIEALSERGIAAPFLLRIHHFLDQALLQLHNAFQSAFQSTGYQGVYRGVFPIKVNQQAEVISHLMQTGLPLHYGLEAGSKPELLIALSQPRSPESLLICNGSKDESFVRLATLSRKLGQNTVIVIESLDEFDVVHKVSTELGIRPLLGVRVKLTERVTGKWQESSGDRSTFGLGAHELVTLIDRMKAAGFLDCLVLQHSHLGSQVPDIIDIRRAAAEACRFFVELTAMGAPLTHLDLGGGLGVDYTGERRSDENSVNYTVEEYCTNVVETIRYAMDEAALPHPTIVTESGRFVVAHSSIFVFNVLGATLYDSATKPDTQEGDNHLLHDLMAVENYIDSNRFQEALNDALYYRDELRALFRRGQIGLAELARAEQGFLYLASRFKATARSRDVTGDAQAQLGSFVDYYYGNFSLFQSLPDVWAIDQLHPIVPLQRLNEEPTRQAIFSDITCDSDGKIDKFILADGASDALPVHDLKADEPYHIGVFFVGAYQETLGDLHNLFGDANVVTISLDGQGGFNIEHETEADTIAEVMSYVEYDPRDCLDAFRKTVERALAAGQVNTAERRMMIAAYKDALAGHTYFD